MKKIEIATAEAKGLKMYKSKAYEFSLKCNESPFHKMKITCSRDIFKFASQLYADDIQIYESIFTVFLNRSNNTIGFVKISQGGISSTVLDVRLVLKYALESLCSAIILIHNHPTNNMMPSEPDIRITSKLKDAAKIMDITLLDHLIISKDNYYSFADENMM